MKKDEFIEKYQTYDGKTLRSSTWSLGGTSCGWDGNTVSYSAELPKEFTEFDDLLLEVCPNIGILQYKKLRNESVRVNEEEYHDYYGGSSTDAMWVCDLDKLFDTLVSLNLIENG